MTLARELQGPRTGASMSLDRSVTIAPRLPAYRLYDTAGGNLGEFEDPATTIAPGDILVLEDGRDARVTNRIETADDSVWATLVVFVAPTAPRIPTWRGVEFPAPRRITRAKPGSKVR